MVDIRARTFKSSQNLSARERLDGRLPCEDVWRHALSEEIESPVLDFTSNIQNLFDEPARRDPSPDPDLHDTSRLQDSDLSPEIRVPQSSVLYRCCHSRYAPSPSRIDSSSSKSLPSTVAHAAGSTHFTWKTGCSAAA